MSVLKFKDPSTGTWVPVGYSGGGGGTSYTDEQVRDVVAAFVAAGANMSISHDDAGDTLTFTATGGSGGGITTEDAVDAVAAAFAAGTHTGVTVTYNDAANSISLTASGGGGGGITTEDAVDAVAGALVAGQNMLVTYNDAANTITLDVTGAPSAASGVFPFMYQTSTAESITGSGMRGNVFPITGATKLWVSETTTDGLNVALGMGRIKAGWQQYIQDYTDATKYAVYNVTADAIDKGTYWEIAVALVSSGGSLGAGKIAYQSLSPSQSNKLFSTTTTAAGLTPGSNGAGATAYLNGAGAWTTPPGGVANAGGVSALWAGTQAAFDAIVTKNPTTLYFING